MHIFVEFLKPTYGEKLRGLFGSKMGYYYPLNLLQKYGDFSYEKLSFEEPFFNNWTKA